MQTKIKDELIEQFVITIFRKYRFYIFIIIFLVLFSIIGYDLDDLKNYFFPHGLKS